MDFRHLWKVVGEGITLTFLSLPWVTPQISTTKINISIEIYQKSSYFSIEIEKNIQKSRKITKVSTSLKKSRSRPKSTILAELIEISQLSRLTFENRRDCPSCRDHLLKTVEIESLNRYHVETNRDPQGYLKGQKGLKMYLKGINIS